MSDNDNDLRVKALAALGNAFLAHISNLARALLVWYQESIHHTSAIVHHRISRITSDKLLDRIPKRTMGKAEFSQDNVETSMQPYLQIGMSERI